MLSAQAVSSYPKYPMMRRMFYSKSVPPLAQYTMWFDDDSRITRIHPRWWDKVAQVLYSDPGSIGQLGQIWYMKPLGNQLQAIADQPWYTGVPILI